VELNKSGSHYIDARKDVRHPDKSFIEVVREGFVRYRTTVPNTHAPEVIMMLARRAKEFQL
jgi:hypothetical protein